MGLFSGQMANVVEWEEFRDDVIFWRWANREIKKGSRLVIRPGQDAIFLYNGRVEGIFTDEGSFEIESQIIPVLSTLKGFKFGFNSGLRAEVLFVNTKEFTIAWGTPNAVNIPAPGLPGGLPVRAFGTSVVKVGDYMTLIDKVAGVRSDFTVDDIRQRVMGLLDQALMKWIAKEGRDVFHLQSNAAEIGAGICGDLDMELRKFGFAMLNFTISNVNYPPEIQDKINKAASYSMVGDMDRYRQVGMVDAMNRPGSAAGDAMGTMAGMAAGFKMAEQFAGDAAPSSHPVAAPAGVCAACGAAVPPGSKFCPGCGAKVDAQRFCPQCGASLVPGAKFCPGCGAEVGNAT